MMPYQPLSSKKNLAGVQPEIFQGRRGFVELGYFDKHFVKNTRKILEVFSPRYS